MNKAAEVGVNDIGLDKTMEEEIPDSMSTFTDDISSDDNSEGGTRGARVPPLFLDQNEAQRAEKTFFEATPPSPHLSGGLDPPLGYPYILDILMFTYVASLHCLPQIAFGNCR